MKKHRIYTMSFASVYPHYVAKAEKKGRTKAGVDGNGRQAASGVYIITLSTPEFRLVEKALLVHWLLLTGKG